MYNRKYWKRYTLAIYRSRIQMVYQVIPCSDYRENRWSFLSRATNFGTYAPSSGAEFFFIHSVMYTVKLSL
jgi:hypothetical protein